MKYSTTRDVVHQLPSERLEDPSWNLCWENAGHNTAPPHQSISPPRWTCERAAAIKYKIIMLHHNHECVAHRVFGERLDGRTRGPLQTYKPRAEEVANAQSFRDPRRSHSTLTSGRKLEPMT